MKKGWEIKRLDQLFDVKSSKRVLQSEWKEAGIPFYRGREITTLSKFGTVDNELFIDKAHYKSLREKYGVPEPEDLMVTAIGTIGNAYIVQEHDKFYFKDASVLWLKKTSGVISKFILHWINSTLFKEQLNIGHGATVDTLTISKLASLQLSLPPLEEQRKIVAILDEAFEGLDRARANTEANLASVKELFSNFLSMQMVSDSTTWTRYNFADASVLKIVDGDRGTNYPKKTEFTETGFCLFLNTKNVSPDGFDFGETMFISREKDNLLRKGKLKPRDVIMTTRGTIGNVAIFDETVPYKHIRINSGMLILRPNESLLRSEFLFELLRSKVIKDQIATHVSGTAQPQLPIRSLSKFILPAPKSLSEQMRIVERLREISKELELLTLKYLHKREDLSDLRQSLLQKAFAGELT